MPPSPLYCFATNRQQPSTTSNHNGAHYLPVVPLTVVVLAPAWTTLLYPDDDDGDDDDNNDIQIHTVYRLLMLFDVFCSYTIKMWWTYHGDIIDLVPSLAHNSQVGSSGCFSAHFIITSKIRTVTPRPGWKCSKTSRQKLELAWMSKHLEIQAEICLQNCMGISVRLCGPRTGQVPGRHHHPKDLLDSPRCASLCETQRHSSQKLKSWARQVLWRPVCHAKPAAKSLQVLEVAILKELLSVPVLLSRSIRPSAKLQVTWWGIKK